jgi:hypothetical protein
MFTPRPLRRSRGAHAATRGGAVIAPAVPAPPPSAPPPPTASVRALDATAAGDWRVAASYLTTLPDADLETARAAAGVLSELAAAVARLRQRDPLAEPPAGFRLCLGCQIGDCPACGDPVCAHHRLHHPNPAAADPEPPGDNTRFGPFPEPAPDDNSPAAAGDRGACD